MRKTEFEVKIKIFNSYMSLKSLSDSIEVI
jgi:hypothetical protein